MDDHLWNKAQYNAGSPGRIKLRFEAVPTLKGHKSELQAVSDTVLNVCAVFALDVCMEFNTNIMDTLSELAAKVSNHANKCIYMTTECIHLLLLQLLRNAKLLAQAGAEQTEMSCCNLHCYGLLCCSL